MARRLASKEYRAFVGGLVTEASPLTFPENASEDEDNCVIRSDGSRRRRLGMDQEESGSKIASISSTEPSIVSEFLWTDVAAIATLSFRVTQVGDTLHFFESTDTGALSANKKSFTVDLGSFSFTKTDASTSTPGTEPCSFASGKGILVVANKEMDPFYIEYDESSDSITTNKIDVRIRDFTGVNDGLALTERPSTLTDAHKYNLLNQGWSDPENPTSAPLTLVNGFFSTQSVYPSNADVLATGYERFVNTSNDTVVNFTPAVIVKAQVGSSPAPKGSQIYNPFEDDRTLPSTPPSSSFTSAQMSNTGVNTALTAGDTVDIVLFDKGTGLEINRATVTIPAESQTMGDMSTAINSAFAAQNFPSTATSSVTTVSAGADPVSGAPLFAYILNVEVMEAFGFKIENDTANFVTGLTITLDEGTASSAIPSPTPKDSRPAIVALFSGRVWYTGEGGDVYFSQILNDTFSNIGKCYQSNDPTSIETPDLLDTDGGRIRIAEAAEWRGAEQAGTTIIFFAANGAWQIRGIDDYFKATDIVINKISNKGLIGKRALSETDAVPVWMSSKGLHTIVQDAAGQLTVSDITGPTLQTFTDNIPLASRKKALITFDFPERAIVVLYSSDGNNPHKYDRQLNVSVKLEGAAYPWSFSSLSSDSPIILSAAPVEREYDLVTGKWSTAYLTIQYNSSTADWDAFFSVPNNRSFKDWKSIDGTGANYVSYLQTGYDTFEDIRRNKNIENILVYFKRTEEKFIGNDSSGYVLDYPSSCDLIVKFDFTDNDSPNKWHNVGEVYRRKQDYRPEDVSSLDFDNGFPVNIAKESVRGNGKAVQFRFESNEGEDFHLLGWAVDVSVGERT